MYAMARSVDISELQRCLTYVTNQLEQLQQPPSERNKWWRRPIPGVSVLPSFSSFRSLRCRDRRQSEHTEFSRDTGLDMSKVDKSAGSLLDPPSDSSHSEPDQGEHNFESSDEACDSAKNMSMISVKEVNVLESVIPVDSVEELSSVVNSSIEGVDNGPIATDLVSGEERDKNIIPYAVTTSTPVKGENSRNDLPEECVTMADRPPVRSVTKLLSNVSMLGDMDKMDSHPEPVHVRTCQSVATDKKPPDISESLYQNVVSMLFGGRTSYKVYFVEEV